MCREKLNLFSLHLTVGKQITKSETFDNKTLLKDKLVWCESENRFCRRRNWRAYFPDNRHLPRNKKKLSRLENKDVLYRAERKIRRRTP